MNERIYIDNSLLKIISFFNEHLLEDVHITNFKNFLHRERIFFDDLETYLSRVGPDLFIRKNEHIYLNFNNRFIFSLKMANDLFYLESLSAPVKTEIFLIYEELMKAAKDNILSVVLIGSAARNRMRPSSDIDLLVIAKKALKKKFTNYIYKIEPLYHTKETFNSLVAERDELAIWAIKYGLIVYDNDHFHKYLMPQSITIGPTSIIKKRKLIHELIDEIPRSPDMPVTRMVKKIERLIYQMARLIIILHQEIPLSRWELAEQVDKYSPAISSKIKDFYNSPGWTRDRLMEYFFEVKSIFHKELRELNSANIAGVDLP